MREPLSFYFIGTEMYTDTVERMYARTEASLDVCKGPVMLELGFQQVVVRGAFDNAAC